MRHYEIIFLVHPNQSSQVTGMLERYQQTLTKNGGKVHRLEDWKRRILAYPINKLSKAHYLLINVECNPQEIEELKSIFKFNDSILRYLITKTKHAETETTAIMKEILAEKKEASSQN